MVKGDNRSRRRLISFIFLRLCLASFKLLSASLQPHALRIALEQAIRARANDFFPTPETESNSADPLRHSRPIQLYYRRM